MLALNLVGSTFGTFNSMAFVLIAFSCVLVAPALGMVDMTIVEK